MNNTLHIVATRDRPKILQRMLISLIGKKMNLDSLILIDERGTMEENTSICDAFEVDYIVHKEDGLNNIVNLGIKRAIENNYSYVMSTNDDVIFEVPDEIHPTEVYPDWREDENFKVEDWYDKATELLDTECKMISFCIPNRGSAWVMKTETLQTIELLDSNFVDGYWEDGDLSLTLGSFCKKKPARTVEEGIAVIRNWIKHLNPGTGRTWNHDGKELNREVFYSKWKRVEKDHPMAREMKISEEYWALTSELKSTQN